MISAPVLPAPRVHGSRFGGPSQASADSLAQMKTSLRERWTPPVTGAGTHRLEYRPPLDWAALRTFLTARATPGVEHVTADGRYQRTLRLGRFVGWLTIGPAAAGDALEVEASAELSPALAVLLPRVRRFLDLDIHPSDVVAHLGADPVLGKLVARRPGLRVARTVDGFELALRVVLGQQVSVRGASTLAGRLAAALCEPLEEVPGLELRYLPVAAERLAQASLASVRDIGLPASRAACLIRLGRAVAAGELPELASNGVLPERATAEPTDFLRRFTELPGIGPWTAAYVAMRALGWSDAFPEGDLGLRSAMGGASPARMRLLAERWRPWRSYAAQHLWAGLGDPDR